MFLTFFRNASASFYVWLSPVRILSGFLCRCRQDDYDNRWSAFTNISMENWNYYVNYRHSQGFNCVQINVLKQWDSSGDELNLYPFPIKKDGEERGDHFEFDYSVINEEYFDAAEEKLKVLAEYGMTPVLVLLWGNYVPGTWESRFTNNNLFPYEALELYVSYVTKRFKKYEPIYFVSGDSDFPTEETVKYYRKVLETARANDPDAIYTFHINGESMEIPEELEKEADFFIYQSGHFLTLPVEYRRQNAVPDENVQTDR